ncbi:7496_t:CDS:1, partial [Dentiscutata erythropus]
MVDNGYEINSTNRNILLRLCNGSLQRISECHSLYDPLHYVLFLSEGDD